MRIHFIGSGWLAQPTARHCQDLGHPVQVTTTDASKAQALQQAGLPAQVYRLGDELEPSSELFAADVLIIAITSKDLAGFQSLMRQTARAKVPHLIFVSSTSVYANSNTPHAEDSAELNEANPLLAIERLIQQHPQATIIRLAGLVGPGRHPGRFFTGGKTIKQPNAPVNLIHLDDCIGILHRVIQQNAWGEVFNGCADTHPKKGMFYPAMAQQLGMTPPVIDPSAENTGDKIILNDKVKQTLNYRFKYPDVMTFSY